MNQFGFNSLLVKHSFRNASRMCAMHLLYNAVNVPLSEVCVLKYLEIFNGEKQDQLYNVQYHVKVSSVKRHDAYSYQECKNIFVSGEDKRNAYTYFVQEDLIN